MASAKVPPQGIRFPDSTVITNSNSYFVNVIFDNSLEKTVKMTT
jgi:hypothetical protein